MPANANQTTNKNPQGVWWMATVPVQDFMPFLYDGFNYIGGQQEIGANGGYHHWQLYFGLKKKSRRNALKALLGNSWHLELTRSAAAEEYCQKGETAVEGTQFFLGVKPLKRNCVEDWDAIRTAAKTGKFDDIPSNVFVRSYSALRNIRADHMPQVEDLTGVCGVWIWGPPDTGKSFKARHDYGVPYLKGTNKWWTSWKGTEDCAVIEDIDEAQMKFMSGFLKIWADRYCFPALIHGSQVFIRPKLIVCTSNYSLDQLTIHDEQLRLALTSRFKQIHLTALPEGVRGRTHVLDQI